MKFFYLMSAFFCLQVSLAQAANVGGLFVEPMLTYERGEGDLDFPSPFNNSTTRIDGFGVGARLGFHLFESFFLGLDGRYSMPQFKDSALDQDVKAKAWNYGPVIGMQMPTSFALRLWAGYIYDGELDPDKDKNVDEKFMEAHGYRIGGGIKLGIVSVNLEYQDLKYDSTQINEVGIFTTGYSDSSIELNNSSWLLSASFPFSF